MQRLNVGLLDTVLGPPIVKVGEKPPPPRTRPEPEVIDTGHVVLAHTTRTGEDETVWYRGPLVPHPGGRDAPDVHGALPFLHSSDQAKRIGPDGRENLSLAAAFEIGRLLALAEPRIVAAFLNWRKEGFERARRIELADVDAQLRRVDITRVMEGFAARLGNQLLLDLGKNDATRLGKPRPLVDGGCPIAGIDGLDVTQLIATGFGLPIDAVRRLIDPGATIGGGLTVPVDDRPTELNDIAANPARDLSQLRDIARGTVIDIATDVLANRVGPAGGAPRPDALDGLLGGG